MSPKSLIHAAAVECFGLTAKMATASITNGIVHITTGRWSDKYPVADLDKWIAFNRRMLKRYGHPSYKDELDALIGVRED